jgi:hypothetical protein
MRRVPVTREMAAQIQAAKTASTIPSNVRRQIQSEALASQRVAANKIYYSRIRFAWELKKEPEIGTFVCLNPTTRFAFGYQLQQDVDGHAGHRATYADTNLLEARSTNSGEVVSIVGIGVRHTPISDAFLASLMDQFVAVTLRVDNDALLRMGNPSDIPGAAQTTDGTTYCLWPNALDQFGKVFVPTQKGRASQENFLVLGEPIIWKPSNKDSKLDIEFQNYESICWKLPDEREYLEPTCCQEPEIPNGPRNSAEGFQGPYKHPEKVGDPGTFVDYFVKLYCQTDSTRSVNQ